MLVGVVVDVVGDALVHLVADVVGPELRRRHFTERQRDDPGDVATERGGDDVAEGVEPPVVLLERRGRSRRRVARQGRQPLEPLSKALDEPEVGLEPRAIGGAELRGQVPIFLIREVERGAAVRAGRVTGGRGSEHPFPGVKRCVLHRQPDTGRVVGDGTASLERGVDRQLQRGQPVGPRDVRGDELVQRR